MVEGHWPLPPGVARGGQSARRNAINRYAKRAPTHRRQAVILARDAATKTCSIQIDGDTTQHDGAEPMDGVVPIVGATVWCLQQGTDWLIFGTQGVELPKCRISSGAVRTTTNGAAEKAFDFAGGSVDIDTDGMANIANDRIDINWPGKYVVGASVRHEGASAGNGRRVADVVKNSISAPNTIVRGDAFFGAADRFTLVMEENLVAGDFIQLAIYGGDTGQPNVNWGDANYQTKLWAVYLP